MKKNNKGFSLVELIIVIAIMAVLVAVLAPQYIKYVERSRVAKDATTLDEILRSAQIAVADSTVSASDGEVTLAIDNTSGVITFSDGATTQATGIVGTIEDTIGSTPVLVSSTGKGFTTLHIVVDMNTGAAWDNTDGTGTGGTTNSSAAKVDGLN